MAEKTNIANDPRVIEEDLARTRDEMSGTVNAIQKKLSPGHFKDRIRSSTIDKVKGAASRFGQTAKGTGTDILDTVKSNPVPIAMIGAGLAWLVYNTKTENSGNRFLSERGSQVKEKAGELTGRAQAKMEALSDRAREKRTEFAKRARLSAEKVSSAARERASGARSRFEQMMYDNPFGMTLAAFAIGSAVGFSIRESSKEKDLMGHASESLLEKAKDTAQSTFQKAQHAAEKAFQTAKSEFK